VNLDLDEYQRHPNLYVMEDDHEEDSGVATVSDTKTKRPRLYNVFLHNDDYTTMEFVIYVLKRHFSKTEQEAEDIMLQVHHKGLGLCGTYTFEVAETKVNKVMKEAKREEHPLHCSFEPES